MRFIKLLLLIVLINSISIGNVLGLSVDNNNIYIEKGKSNNIVLSADVDNASSISFNLVYTTYDIPADFIVNSKYRDVFTNTKHRVVFNSPTTGKVNLGNIKINVVNNPKDKLGLVNITSVNVYDDDGNVIKNLNPLVISVNVVEENNIDVNDKKEEVNPEEKEETKNEDNNILKSIDSNIVNINVKDNVYDYTIYIDSDVKELDLKPIINDNSYKVDISSQKIGELKDDKIVITLSKGDKKIIYNIKVNVKENIVIDSNDTDNKSFKYKGKWGILISIFTVSLAVLLVLFKRKK